MKELAYTHTSPEGEKEIYTIVEYASEDSFDFMKNGEQVHRAVREDGKWIQEDGDACEDYPVQSLGEFVDAHRRQGE